MDASSIFALSNIGLATIDIDIKYMIYVYKLWEDNIWDINYIESKIYNGNNFCKVNGISQILSISDDCFTYSIGKTGNYKKVTYDEAENAVEEIEIKGYIDRKWFEERYTKIANAKPCNFISIGGVLQELGYVSYVKNKIAFALNTDTENHITNK